MATDVKAQVQAYRSFADWLEAAEVIRKSFHQARLPLPDQLQAVIGGNGNLTPIPAALKPLAPLEADGSWVWVEVKKAMAGTLALAVVRASGTPLTTREIHEKVQELGVDAVVGTIANTGTRNKELKVIEYTDDGKWVLLQTEKAAVLHGDYLWGLPSIFQIQELAANRRNAVVYLLKESSGLQVMQIVNQLRSRQLVHPDIPMNKTLIKDDLEAMEGTRTKRHGKKWEAIEQ